VKSGGRSDPPGGTVERFRAARSDPTRAVLEGFHPLKHGLRFGAEVEEALSPAPDRVLELARELAPDLVDDLRRLLVEIRPDLYAKLAPVPPESGVIALARRPAVSEASILRDPSPAPAVFLEEPAHLGNLGAAIRVAAGAGAAGVLASGRHDPWHAAALRGSAGLHFAIPVASVGGELPDSLPKPARPRVAIDPAGEELVPDSLPDRALLLFGSERRGLAARTLEHADLRLRIPMRPGVSSLNLATAVAVTLYAWRLPLGRAGGS